MKIELYTEDLIALLKGVPTSPDFSDHILIKHLGSFNASVGVWLWDEDKLEVLSDVELYSVYLLCKNIDV